MDEPVNDEPVWSVKEEGNDLVMIAFWSDGWAHGLRRERSGDREQKIEDMKYLAREWHRKRTEMER